MNECQRSERIIVWFFITIFLIAIVKMFIGCSGVNSQAKLPNVKAQTPLGVLLGCSKHQKGFTQKECGEMWNWEVIVNDKK